MSGKTKKVIGQSIVNFAIIASTVGIGIVCFKIGQLHPKYTPEEQIEIRDVQNRYDRGELYGMPNYKPSVEQTDHFKDEEKNAEPKCEGAKTNSSPIKVTVKAEGSYASSRITWDVGIIAETIWREAKGESSVGRKAVASVIVNRIRERKMSGASVCLEAEQFSCWNGCRPKINTAPWLVGKSSLNPKEKAVWSECLSLARSVSSRTLKPTTRANHYYNPSKSRPSWRFRLTNVQNIGRHRFGRI